MEKHKQKQKHWSMEITRYGFHCHQMLTRTDHLWEILDGYVAQQSPPPPSQHQMRKYIWKNVKICMYMTCKQLLMWV